MGSPPLHPIPETSVIGNQFCYYGMQTLPFHLGRKTPLNSRGRFALPLPLAASFLLDHRLPLSLAHCTSDSTMCQGPQQQNKFKIIYMTSCLTGFGTCGKIFCRYQMNTIILNIPDDVTFNTLPIEVEEEINKFKKSTPCKSMHILYAMDQINSTHKEYCYAIFFVFDDLKMSGHINIMYISFGSNGENKYLNSQTMDLENARKLWRHYINIGLFNPLLMSTLD